MCGIAGIAGPGRLPSPHPALRRMLEAQRHRGPEELATGALDGPSGAAAFGYCKLGFVDIRTSRQPGRSRDGRILLVFNGEIYNHRELRSALAADGAPCTEPGEAALLAELYAREGLALLLRLEGMFALGIHDRERGETVLARDRFGKKPLFYLPLPGGVAFASELSALRHHPACGSEVDPRALALYLTFNAVPAPSSLLAGVSKVPAGTAVRVRGGEFREERFWTLRLAPRPRDRQEAAAELRRRLDVAVARRLSGEAPVGVLLSGGLDSGMVAAAARRLAGEPPRTFSAGFPEDATFDETSHAEAVACHLGTRHTTVPLTRRLLADTAAALLPALDEPIADQSLVPTHLLCRAARADVKAVLTGDGADELLMGYRIFQAAAALRGLGRVVPHQLIARGLAWLGERRPSDANLHFAHVSQLLTRTLGAAPERQFYLAAAAFPPDEWSAILHPDLLPTTAGLAPFAEIDGWIAAHPRATPAERLQLGMVCHFLRDVILAKLDRASMLASVEARSPFLDAGLADLLLGLPQEAKMRRGQTKVVLKRLAREELPPRLVHRRKQGFRLPTAALLRTDLRGLLGDLLAPAALRRTGLFRPEAVERLVAEHLAGARDHHRRLWSLLCFQAWQSGAARLPAAATVEGAA